MRRNAAPTPEQLAVLRAIYGGIWSADQLAAELGIRKDSLLGRVDRLEAGGWLVRFGDGWCLTSRGEQWAEVVDVGGGDRVPRLAVSDAGLLLRWHDVAPMPVAAAVEMVTGGGGV